MYPGGRTRVGLWDGDGNQVLDSILNTGGTGTGRWPYAALRRVSGRLFDGRGKVWRSIDRSFFGDSLKAGFNGLGLVDSTKFHQSGKNQLHNNVEYGSRETFIMDPLGNMSVLTRRDSINAGGTWTTKTTNNSYVYRAATGRLVTLLESLTQTTYHYDLSGNLHFESQLLTAGKRERAATYDAAGRLGHLWCDGAARLPPRVDEGILSERRGKERPLPVG